MPPAPHPTCGYWLILQVSLTCPSLWLFSLSTTSVHIHILLPHSQSLTWLVLAIWSVTALLIKHVLDDFLSYLVHTRVIRIELDTCRCFSVVTEEKDKEKEVVHITSVHKTCVYPQWSLEIVIDIVVNKKKRKWKNKKRKKNLKTDKGKSKGCVVIPYVKGLSENIARVMKKNMACQ